MGGGERDGSGGGGWGVCVRCELTFRVLAKS